MQTSSTEMPMGNMILRKQPKPTKTASPWTLTQCMSHIRTLTLNSALWTCYFTASRQAPASSQVLTLTKNMAQTLPRPAS